MRYEPSYFQSSFLVWSLFQMICCCNGEHKKVETLVLMPSWCATRKTYFFCWYYRLKREAKFINHVWFVTEPKLRSWNSQNSLGRHETFHAQFSEMLLFDTNTFFQASEISVNSLDDPSDLTGNWQFTVLELACCHYAAIYMEKDVTNEGL